MTEPELRNGSSTAVAAFSLFFLAGAAAGARKLRLPVSEVSQERAEIEDDVRSQGENV